MDVGSPFLMIGNELAHKLIRQILEAGNTSRGKTIEPGLCHLLQGSREVLTIGSIINI